MSDLATLSRPASVGTLLDRLVHCGWEFDFFKAVWLLERLSPERTPVGQRGPVASEAIQFRPHVSVGFPPTDVRRVLPVPGRSESEAAHLVEVTFMGLYGVSTPLPLHYAIEVLRSVEPYSPGTAESQDEEDAAESASDLGNSPTRDFLDLFHHRLVSLFYRAWTKYRYDAVYGMPGRDRLTTYLLWLIGVPPHYDEGDVGVVPTRLLRYAGTLTQHPRSGASLEGLLFDYWNGVEVQVEPWAGRWVALSPHDLNSIGLGNCRLGLDLTVGEQIFDLSGAFSITLGPVDWETYLTFLPGGERFSQTRSLVRLHCVDPLAFNIEMKLYPGQVPPTQLTSDETSGRLGFTSWLLTGDSPETSVTFDATLPVPSQPEPDGEVVAAGGEPAYEVARGT